MNKQKIEILLEKAEKPSRYLGNEWNSIRKNKEDVTVRIALAFPDLYELGLGNLGLQILYSKLNELHYVWAERVYAPAPDLAKTLIEKQISLFLWESKDPVKSVDLLGFTLQSELTYTTVLNILHLSQIPIFSEQRDDTHPLICAGGPCCANPEPLAPFIDFFVIGDGEDVAIEIAQILKELKGKSRIEKLSELYKLEGVYIPSFAKTITTPSGFTIPEPEKLKVKRRIVKKLTYSNYINNYIVPYTQLVHEGISIEVMRGCTRTCRFCLAGCFYRPVRERTPDEVFNLTAELLKKTGLESVSLVSLSTCDHSQINTMLKKLLQLTIPKMTSISLPSLRLDAFSVNLADMVTGVRRSGLTFAPEAGSERLRKFINKTVSNENLLDIVRIAFSKGWTHIKLYFMIGLPTETDEDISELINLVKNCLAEAKKIRKDAKIHLGISTFVPKPWTPFQWERQIPIQETKDKQLRILSELRKYKSIKISFHSPESSFIEGLISRGDRTIAKLIYLSWQKGAYLETSTDQIKLEHWLSAIDELQLNPQILLGERKLEEPLPWDFIDMGLRKEWLMQERELALKGITTPDCREGRCHQCGIQNYTKTPCIKWNSPDINIHSNYTEIEKLTPIEKTPKQRLLLKIGKIGTARLLSHLEFYHSWIRALRRAELPLAYTQGYHAHPKISLALPAPVGEIVLEEFMEIWLTQNVDTDNKLIESIRKQLPEGFLLHSIETIPLQAPSLMQRTKGLEYVILLSNIPIENQRQLQTDLEETFEKQWDLVYTNITTLNDTLIKNKDTFEKTTVFEIKTRENSIYLRWVSPIINNKFLKPSILKETLEKKHPELNITIIRTHTFIDHIPIFQSILFSIESVICAIKHIT